MLYLCSKLTLKFDVSISGILYWAIVYSPQFINEVAQPCLLSSSESEGSQIALIIALKKKDD